MFGPQDRKSSQSLSFRDGMSDVEVADTEQLHGTAHRSYDQYIHVTSTILLSIQFMFFAHEATFHCELGSKEQERAVGYLFSSGPGILIHLVAFRRMSEENLWRIWSCFSIFWVPLVSWYVDIPLRQERSYLTEACLYSFCIPLIYRCPLWYLGAAGTLKAVFYVKWHFEAHMESDHNNWNTTNIAYCAVMFLVSVWFPCIAGVVLQAREEEGRAYLNTIKGLMSALGLKDAHKLLGSVPSLMQRGRSAMTLLVATLILTFAGYCIWFNLAYTIRSGKGMEINPFLLITVVAASYFLGRSEGAAKLAVSKFRFRQRSRVVEDLFPAAVIASLEDSQREEEKSADSQAKVHNLDKGGSQKLSQDELVGPSHSISLRRMESEIAKSSCVYARNHAQVTVLFADIVGFTHIASESAAEEVIEMLHDLYCSLDALCLPHNVYKVDTIGDSYMIASGLFNDGSTSIEESLGFGVKMLQVAQKVKDPQGNPVRLRVGMHVGPVISAIVGRSRRKYSLFGDTVNMASRMESTGTAGHIQVTEEVFNEMCKRWPRLEDIDQSGDCFSSRASSSETETPALDEASMLTYLNKQICWNWVRRSNVYLKHKGSFTTYLCQVRESDQ